MEKVKHICKQCVGFQASVEQEISENTKDWLKRQWAQNRQDYRQLSFADLSFNIAQTQVYVFNISSQFIRNLITSPEEMYKLTPVMFEELICERLSAMGFGVQQVGGHTYHKDGGIDVVAWTKLHEFPFLMAIQAKYHHSPMVKTGPQSVRDLLGTVKTLPFHVGVLVTNTTFRPDAAWMAKQQPTIIRLRDIQDIRRWLVNDFLDEYDWREVPAEIQVCPGVTIKIPKTKVKS